MNDNTMTSIILLAAAAAVAMVTPLQGKELLLFLIAPIRQKFILSCSCIFSDVVRLATAKLHATA